MNVIPSEAEATIDIRALPDEDVPAFYDEMRRSPTGGRIEPLNAGAHGHAPSRTIRKCSAPLAVQE
jgi:acetylornithine deacetylase/succinyl-diaminopimelate desuccinylase-like protein